jgi:hypothetical protein
MKIIWLIMAFVLLASGCIENDITGKYVNNKNQSATLNADHTYLYDNGKVLQSGTWAEMKDKQYLITSGFGTSMVVTIDGNVLTDKDGERWIKK